MASSSSPTEPWDLLQTEPWNLSQENQFRKSKSHKKTEPWDIFINYCLRNVNRTLASAIYHRLSSMGLHVFLDVKVLRFGDCFSAEIQHAMATAKLHIAIFSPIYAYFAWCLAELSFMLKTGAKIIPIFYHIEPSDLRSIVEGKGKYAGAFSEYEKKRRYSMEKLNEWKMALHDISFLNGYKVNNIQDEAAVLNNIVNHAFKIIKTVPLFVCEHPAGLDELVQDFQSVASGEKGKITGIVGMGGSGKTTLAKELFNRNFSSFEFCTFISGLREAASRNALPDMQKKLLSNLGVYNYLPFDTVDEGKSILANCLRSVRVLLVLDDVDHIDQLNALLPNKDMLGSCSMVIVTSRDLGILKSWGVFCIYKMPRFHILHAKQLFCWQAFMKSSPPAEFRTLVQKFVQVCDGLPVSLTVLGTQLYGRTKEYWKTQLNEISRVLPGEIQQRLQVSYDSLDQEQKETFLDVACFLIGERKSSALTLWDGSGWSGLHDIETLENKCLVDLVDDPDYSGEKIIGMHNLLRVMGKDIASRNKLYRVWCPNQIVNMNEHSMKRNVIRGIKAVRTGIGECKSYGEEDMANIREGLLYLAPSLVGLKLLVIRGDFLNQIVAQVSRELLWLRWFQIGQKNIPAWLSLKHLRILELYEDSGGEHHLEELWEEDGDVSSLPFQLY